MPLDTDRFKIGIELEYPVVPSMSDEAYRTYGTNSSHLADEIRADYDHDWPHGGQNGTDISVGVEINSGSTPGAHDGISLGEARDWYSESLDTLAHYGRFAPVGVMDSRDQTAGLHIHFSHPDEEIESFSQWLYQVSGTDWMKAFACTSIADQGGTTTYPVFRGTRHCKMTYDSRRTSVVRAVSRSAGHFEWRLPEPMNPSNFDLLMEFLERAIADRDAAAQWAQEIVYQGSTDLTSVVRANATQLASFEPPADISGIQVVRGTDSHTASFYDHVHNSSTMPYIYRIHTEDGRYLDTYYLLSPMGRDPSAYDVNSEIQHLFPDSPDDEFLVGNEWVVGEYDDGLEITSHDTASDIIQAANAAHNDEIDVETSDATEVLLEAIA